MIFGHLKWCRILSINRFYRLNLGWMIFCTFHGTQEILPKEADTYSLRQLELIKNLHRSHWIFFEIKTSVLATILFARLTLRKQFCPNGTNSSRCEVALFTIDQVEHTTPRSTVSNPNSPPKINMIASLNKSSGIGSIGSIGSTQEIKTKNNTFWMYSPKPLEQ